MVVQDRSVVIARFRSGDLDSEQDRQKRSLAAVFDGHKRAEAAEIASEMLPPLLAKCARACNRAVRYGDRLDCDDLRSLDFCMTAVLMVWQLVWQGEQCKALDGPVPKSTW